MKIVLTSDEAEALWNWSQDECENYWDNALAPVIAQVKTWYLYDLGYTDRQNAMDVLERERVAPSIETVVLTDAGRKELAERIDGMNYTFHDEDGNKIPVVKSAGRVYVDGREPPAGDES